MSGSTGKFSLKPLIAQIESLEKSIGSIKTYQERATVSIVAINKDVEHLTKTNDKDVERLRRGIEDLEKLVGELRDRVTKFEGRMVDNVREKITRLETQGEKVDKLDQRFASMARELSSSIQDVIEATQDIDNRLIKIETADEKAEKIGASIIAWFGLIAGLGAAVAAIFSLFK